MPTMTEMVEAHLMNVQVELQKLGEQKVAIDTQLEKLNTYLQEGAAELNAEKATVAAQAAAPTTTVFTPERMGSNNPLGGT